MCALLGEKMTKEQIKLADSYFWWHKIRLSDNYVTNGICPHGTGSDVTDRFGLPEVMTGIKFLDCGAWDGLFSFEAEKRGAILVDAIDIYQRVEGQKQESINANKPFQLAKEILNSKVNFYFSKLEDFNTEIKYDLIAYYGIMYHIENPLGAVKKLMTVVTPGGVILMETAIAIPSLYSLPQPLLEYRPGFDNDPTNQWYPNREWVRRAFLENGAKSIEVVYEDTHRATYRINA